jgi:hypothetical protein
MFNAEGAHKNNHAAKPRKERRTDRNRVTKGFAFVCKQHNQEKCEDRR